MITIDGSHGEGGGQMLRTALALSVLTGKAFTMTDIRKGRDKPGVKAQHLTAIKAMEQICNAVVEDAELGSDKITFMPGPIKFPKKLELDIGTAGSITLLLQALLPVMIFGKKKCVLKIKGGTDVKWSPQIDYVMNVLIPHLKLFADIEFIREKRGYYPKGGGSVHITVKPKFPSGEGIPVFNFTEQGQLMHIKGVGHCSADLQGVADRMINAAAMAMKGFPVSLQAEYCSTASPGAGITLWAMFSKRGDQILPEEPIRLGADELGEKRVSAEKVGVRAAERLLSSIESKAAVDKYMADQLIPYLGIVPGSKILVEEITEHCKTNIFITEKFLDVKFEIGQMIIESRRQRRNL